MKTPLLKFISPLTCWLLLAVVQICAAATIFGGLPVSGDEQAYIKMGRKLSGGDISVMAGQHFMIGMSVIHAAYEAVAAFLDVRVFMASLSLLITGGIVYLAPKTGRSREIFLFFLAITPMMLYFSTRLWADLIAGFILLIIGLIFVKTAQRNWPLSLTVVLGVMAAILLYFRNNLLLLGPAIFLSVFLIQWQRRSSVSDHLKTMTKQGAALLIGFALLWSPWVAMTSSQFDRLILHPFQMKPHKETTIWGLTPPGVRLGR